MDYISRFDVPKAIDCFEKSLDIAENAGDQATEGKAALTLGIFYQSESNFPKAIENYEKSLNIARKTGDRAREIDGYSSLASVYESCGEFPKAIECYRNSLDISKKAGDREREGKAYYSLGVVYDSLGDSQKAGECYEKGVSITGDVGSAHDSHSDFPLAIELFKASSKFASEAGDWAGVNRANKDLANSYFSRRDFSKAHKYGIEYLKTVNRVGAHTEETAENESEEHKLTKTAPLKVIEATKVKGEKLTTEDKEKGGANETAEIKEPLKNVTVTERAMSSGKEVITTQETKKPGHSSTLTESQTTAATESTKATKNIAAKMEKLSKEEVSVPKDGGDELSSKREPSPKRKTK
ncbi:PREDICTED: tetratricopeptide repeat protein 28-like [Acropora digitifera]|uniref:tetratricopeptide repeat protein 28-like n=1 Tax=Acropora digitifera TaxID=70779 RepID=UPI00077B2120|nr:PREDICTED: tetratricopeptide repeat protein 28-like [Acropora digitifera]